MESYIRLNKEVVATQSELFEVLSEEEKKKFMSLPPGAMESSFAGGGDLYYKDSKGDLAQILFKEDKTQAFTNANISQILNIDLKRRGFEWEYLFGEGENENRAEWIKDRIRQRRAQKLEKEAKKGFSF